MRHREGSADALAQLQVKNERLDAAMQVQNVDTIPVFDVSRWNNIGKNTARWASAISQAVSPRLLQMSREDISKTELVSQRNT